ncbi:MAG: serine hydrolase domain-containing protein [Negativicutes bacterium]|jgi:CubicO group peptidase (beta-lactamase class C family)
MNEILNNSKVIGAVYAVFDKDKLIEARAFGRANIEQNRPLTIDTNMRLASLSKVVTTAAIMQLSERGQLDIDGDIGDYLGYQVRNPKHPAISITVRRLLTHTSSLNDDGGYNALLEHDPGLLLTMPLSNLIACNHRLTANSWYSEQTFLNKRPGEYFLYSNLGYIVLGSIVERVAGINFRDYCQTNIFEPLKMQAAFDAAAVDWQSTATLYRYNDNAVPFPSKSDYKNIAPKPIEIKLPLGNAAGYGPQGGLMCSVPDYARFLGMIASSGTYNGVQVLSKASCDVMQQLQWFTPLTDQSDNAGVGYWQAGLDLQVTDDLVKNLRLAGHGGDAYGLIAGAYYDRISGKGFVMAFTGGQYLPDQSCLGYYSVETDFATAIVRRHAGFFEKSPIIVAAIAGSQTVSVNSRTIILPENLTVDKDMVPEITLNDVLGTPIKSLNADAEEIELTCGAKTLKFVCGSTVAETGEGAKIALATAPYRKAGHFFLPLVAVRDYFEITAEINGR